MIFDDKVLSNFESASRLEWIETNGLGGYASGTISGANSRKYHGLLIAALHPPVGRNVLLSKLDETIVIRANSTNGAQRYELGTNQYPGAIHPKGYRFLTRFEKDQFPIFHFEVGDVKLKKTVAAINGSNTTVILYELLESPSPITLELLPLASSRDYHGLCHANDAIGRQYLFDNGLFRTLNYQGGAEVFISVPKSSFTENLSWNLNMEYLDEQSRGLEFQEDLYSHGKFQIDMKRGESLGVIISTADPTGKNAFKLFSAEKKRRDTLVKELSYNNNVRRLALAADQFVVKRGALHTIIAGYHWFADWGRDTMISLPGICLVTGRFKLAKQILLQFCDHVSDGMLPNRFSDYGERPEYNTIDATLWFFHAIHQYYKYTNDKAFVKSVLPLLNEIIAWHYKGTRFNIKVDAADELLAGGVDQVQLTWMDAKVGDWVVTPRRGKAVEINALWYNALKTMELFYTLTGKSNEDKLFHDRAEKVAQSFNAKFWNDQDKCLYDYIDGDYKNADLRPNQLYALSLPNPVISGERARSILRRVRENLLTPKGLRSLAPNHTGYKGIYNGDRWLRDGAYHQGTVWSYLLGAYIDALFYVDETNAVDQATRIINTFCRHLDEAGIGTVSEVFDGDAPHTPRGCIAQAWGVGEVLRVTVEHKLFSESIKKLDLSSATVSI